MATSHQTYGFCTLFFNKSGVVLSCRFISLIYNSRTQISEVVNSIKDLIDNSRETGTGPMESLAKFPQRTGSLSGFHSQAPQPEGQQQQLQTIPQNSNSDRSSAQVPMQITTSNGMARVNNSLTTASTTTTASTIVGLLHQNSMNSRHQNSMNNASSSYGGNFVQIPSPGYSTLTNIS